MTVRNAGEYHPFLDPDNTWDASSRWFDRNLVRGSQIRSSLVIPWPRRDNIRGAQLIREI